MNAASGHTYTGYSQMCFTFMLQKQKLLGNNATSTNHIIEPKVWGNIMGIILPATAETVFV